MEVNERIPIDLIVGEIAFLIGVPLQPYIADWRYIPLQIMKLI